MSLMTLGICGVGLQIQLDHCTRAAGALAWIHLAFLSTVCLIPFFASLLAELIDYGIVLLIYRFNIFWLGLTLYSAQAAGAKTGQVRMMLCPKPIPAGVAADGGRPIFVRLRRGVLFFEHL